MENLVLENTSSYDDSSVEVRFDTNGDGDFQLHEESVYVHASDDGTGTDRVSVSYTKITDNNLGLSQSRREFSDSNSGLTASQQALVDEVREAMSDGVLTNAEKSDIGDLATDVLNEAKGSAGRQVS